MAFRSTPELLIRNSCQGQALVEFLFSAALLTVFVAGAAPIFRAKWNRTQCAFQVFEKTRSALNSVSHHSSVAWRGITLTNQRDSIRGEGRCGEAKEIVVLPKLEPDS